MITVIEKEKQTVKFILGAMLMIFSASFLAETIYPGLVTAMGVALFLCGAILLFMTVLDMKLAEVEITIKENTETKP